MVTRTRIFEGMKNNYLESRYDFQLPQLYHNIKYALKLLNNTQDIKMLMNYLEHTIHNKHHPVKRWSDLAWFRRYLDALRGMLLEERKSTIQNTIRL